MEPIQLQNWPHSLKCFARAITFVFNETLAQFERNGDSKQPPTKLRECVSETREMADNPIKVKTRRQNQRE